MGSVLESLRLADQFPQGEPYHYHISGQKATFIFRDFHRMNDNVVFVFRKREDKRLVFAESLSKFTCPRCNDVSR